MKYLPLLVLIICSINCNSQDPNPELFQTWYLISVQNTDLSTPIKVAGIVPAVTPTLTISSDNNFNGQGACNTFFGSFTFSNVFPGSIKTTLFYPTLSICSPQIHNSFESSYFEFLKSAIQYQITPLGQGLVLKMFTPLFGDAIFQNYPLKTIDFDSEQIAIYPNPTSSNIFLNLKPFVVSKIQVINSIGQNVKTINNDFESINISDLSPGIYILKISTELGTINKKIIKE